ncbi:TraB/GumN family protein [Mucilaginibacter lacusdianchii]|uniref:TraB/GumN family protein n=1 Tax=Mucilaginibacter lacusdianchii TaxID=2684211 RepID=UPI00131D309C|nr:TraB/GumN family protein [Mucilaginibacter sp. JXJ CY 39]
MKFYKLLALLIIGLTQFATLTHAQTQQKSLLWQIKGKNIKQPTYLFGTVHLFDTTLYKLPQPVFAKLAQTRQVYFELDFGKINPMEMMSKIFITDSTQRIDKLLDTSSLSKLQRLIKTSATLQLLGDNVYRVKPIFITSFLMNDGRTTSIDMEMYKRAVSLKDSVGGLETVAEQLQAIDAIAISTQVQMLKDMLKDYQSPTAIIQNLTKVYVKQDVEHLMEDLSENMPLDPSFNEALLVKRNIVMANRIENLLGKTSTFIAVGGGHLGGKTGLIALLRKKGYTLQPVPFTFTTAALK